jgi:hypothetical protein
MVEVCFTIRSDDLQPSVVTAELGIQPSWAFSKGENYSARRIRPETKEIIDVQGQRPWGVWAMDTKSLDKDVHNHILYLINMLEPKRGELERYLRQKDNFQIGFSIQWSPVEGNFGSYEINSEILIRMSRLSHYIEFSFFGKSSE